MAISINASGSLELADVIQSESRYKNGALAIDSIVRATAANGEEKQIKIQYLGDPSLSVTENLTSAAASAALSASLGMSGE